MRHNRRPVALGRVIALVAPMLCAVPAAAQTAGSSSRPFTIAVAGGVNSATITVPAEFFFDVAIPELDFSVHRLAGFVGGALIGFRVAPPVSFETGGLISVKGVKFTISVPGASATAEIRTTYLDAPAVARVGVHKSGSTTGEVLAGVTTSVLLSARTRFTADGMSESETITSELPRVDVGLTVGGRITVGRVFGDVRYIYGLRDLGEEPGPNGETLKHRVWQFMGGWKF